MLSFESQYTQCQDMSQDNSDAAKTFFKNNINIGQNVLETELGSFYTEETLNTSTVASTASYSNPADLVRLKQAFVTVGTTQYNLEQIYDEDRWQALKASQVDTVSDYAQLIFVRRDTFEIFPTPQTASNTITLRYEAGDKTLQFDDYTDGTITTLANGAKAVTGNSTTFTAAMVGRYFKIDANGIWYKIAAFGTATTLTLDRNYQGSSIAAGSSTYTIGEMPRTPASTHHIPVYYALMNYYQGFKQNTDKGAYFKSLYDTDLKRAKTTYSKRYSSNYLSGRDRPVVVNPNNYPANLS